MSESSLQGRVPPADAGGLAGRLVRVAAVPAAATDVRVVARAAALTVTIGIAAFAAFWRLDVATWLTDEVVYAEAGRAYLDGAFTVNREHPPLVKELLAASQWLFGPTRLAVRLPAAVASLATGLGLFALARRQAGFWAGVGAWAAWGALPHAAWMLAGGRLDRFLVLEVVAAAFAVWALYTGWRWVEERSAGWAAATGALAGLAVASKVSAVLVVVPALTAAPLLRRDRRALGEVVLAVGVLLGAVAVAYAPLGTRAVDAVGYMIDFQRMHGDLGHAVAVAGKVWKHPPWWAYLWWHWRAAGMGAIALAAGLVCLVWARPRVGAYLAAAVVVPFAVLSFGYGRALSHYAYIWEPPLVLAAILGVHALARHAGRARMAGVLLAAVLCVVGAATLARVATVHTSDYEVAAAAIAREASSGAVVVHGYSNVLGRYLPGRRIVGPDGAFAACPGRVAAVVVDPALAERMPVPDLPRFLDLHGAAFDHRRVDRLDLYVRDGAAIADC